MLLIAAVLSDRELNFLLGLTSDLGMETILEIHSEKEAERALNIDAKIIGINNRDLQTFEVNLETTVKLLEKYPELKGRIIVSESGIESRNDIELLMRCGVDAVLIGEAILKAKDIGAKIRELMTSSQTPL